MMNNNNDEFSGVIAPLYICPKHGETYHVVSHNEIDCEHDEIYQIMVCSECGNEVKPILHDGVPVCHPLTVEELYWDSFSLDDNENDWDENQ